jgi:hypothetical protein
MASPGDQGTNPSALLQELQEIEGPIRHYMAYNVPAMTKLMQTYLVPIAVASFQVGCRAEHFIRRSCCQTPLPATVAHLVAFLATTNNSHILFDLDLFAMGVHNHAL